MMWMMARYLLVGDGGGQAGGGGPGQVDGRVHEGEGVTHGGRGEDQPRHRHPQPGHHVHQRVLQQPASAAAVIHRQAPASRVWPSVQFYADTLWTCDLLTARLCWVIDML